MSRVFRSLATGALVEMAESAPGEDGNIRLCALGGGLVWTVSAEAFAADYVAHVLSHVLKPCRVCIDGYKSPFDAFTSEERWNGWAMPWFSMRQVEELAKEMSDLDVRGEEIHISFEKKQGEEEGVNGMGVYRCQEKLVELSPGVTEPMNLVRLGDGWCWEIVSQ